jgi:hypothetical protein
MRPAFLIKSQTKLPLNIFQMNRGTSHAVKNVEQQQPSVSNLSTSSLSRMAFTGLSWDGFGNVNGQPIVNCNNTAQALEKSQTLAFLALTSCCL